MLFRSAGLNGSLTSQWAGSGRAGWKNPSPWPYLWAIPIWALAGWASEVGLMGYPWAFLIGLQWGYKNLTKKIIIIYYYKLSN